MTPQQSSMNFEQISELINDINFRNRCKVAVLKYASYVLTSKGMPGMTKALTDWAYNAFQSPDAIAQSIVAPVCLDSTVLQYGHDINDANLQSAVEAVVQKIV